MSAASEGITHADVTSATEKRCPRCEQVKPIEEFPIRRRGDRWRLYGYCRPCNSEYNTGTKGNYVRRSRQGAQRYKQDSRRSTLKTKYGLTEDNYAEMLDAQAGACAICETTELEAGRRFFAIDHCHSTGRIRGLLCGRCNVALGLFRENPAALVAAIEYLARESPWPFVVPGRS